NALDPHGRLQIRIQPSQDNSSWVGVIEDTGRTSDDDIGALYYVVAVIFIYGLSIVMMIASHIRKNKQDSQLRTYLKEMANLRKSDRREKVLSKMNDLANRRKKEEAMEAKKKKSHVTVNNATGHGEAEVCQLLTKKEDDNTDSVFLPPEFCISPLQSKKFDCLSDVGSYRNASVSSRGSGRNNSTSSCINSNVPSATQSPALSESRYDSSSNRPEPHRLRSPNFYDYHRWRKGDNTRSIGGQDFKTVRLQERLSPSPVEKRSAISPTDSFTEFRVSLQSDQDRFLAIHQSPTYKRGAPNSLTPNNVKFHPSTDMKQAFKVFEIKHTIPASFQVVDEDASL
ncbi:hypothetical protein Bpfe_011349, partial [Biomphalaria pfeifferi]